MASRPASSSPPPFEFHRASLGLCALSPSSATAAATAALWHNRLLGLGAAPPLFVTHDLGWALSLSPHARKEDSLLRQVGGHRRAHGPTSEYCALIRELLDSTQRIAEVLSRCREEVRLALLSHVLLPLCRTYARSTLPALPAPSELPVAASDYPTPRQYGTEPWDLPEGPPFAQSQRPDDPLQPAHAFAQLMVEQRLSLRTQLELIDLDMLRLLGTASVRSAHAGLRVLSEDPGQQLPDLLSILSADVPDVRDIVRFQHDLLPALLEPKRSEDRQRYPIGGHASIERQGSIDSLLGSELVFDDTLFLHRLSDGEALYYGRERPREQQPGPVQILIDASASMRGQRQIFARGLAWALGKRLALSRPVLLRFFDGRLHEAQPMGTGAAAHEALLSLLSFRSLRGRNYARVFADLLRELRSARHADTASRAATGRPTLYIVTHGECHAEVRLFQDLALHADLFALFVMPSGPLRLDYLPSLSGYQAIDEALLDQRDERRRLALELIERATAASSQAGRASESLSRAGRFI
ncbi:MAG: hypothetical protein JNJ46_08225 [Myxococcales bacterium]|nr:hypothetical protein [Myxococcales bacterium]